MHGKEKDAVSIAQALYKGGSSGGMEAVLGSESLSELDARFAYLETSEEINARVFERLASDRSLLEANLAELEEDRAEAAAAESRLAELRSEIEAKVAEQEDEIAELNAAIERAERREAAREAAARRAAAREAAAQRAARREARQDAVQAQPDPQPASSSNPAPSSPSPPAPSGGAAAAVQAALSQVGKPYQWGAAGPNAYDCSGLTMWAWAHGGVSLPHSSSMQYGATARVSRSNLQPGDLMFFGSPIHHVAMYVGGGRMVEAPYSGLSVRVTSAFRSDYVGAGRP
jgi:cell wall-associated NlpC family hydrolase